MKNTSKRIQDVFILVSFFSERNKLVVFYIAYELQLVM
jgi:hypothetical protein